MLEATRRHRLCDQRRADGDCRRASILPHYRHWNVVYVTAMARDKNGHDAGRRAPSGDGRPSLESERHAAPASPLADVLLSETLKRRLNRATSERNVRAVSIALCRGWGEDPDERVPVCDRAGRPTGKTVERWTSFRGEAVAAITAFVIAEDEAVDPIDIAAFASAFMRRAG